MADLSIRVRVWVLALVAALAAGLVASPAIAQEPREYVSLGDSYTAGPLIPPQLPPFGCLKSGNNYSHLAARQLGLSLGDPSCSGARTDHMTQPQGVTPGPNPPQFNSLSATTDVVTLGIGGNDIGFSSIAESCLSLIPFGSRCRGRYVHDGRDEISERIQATEPKVDAVLDGISARTSPETRVFVVTYAAIFPETGNGCWPQMPIARGDVPYLRDKQRELNAMLRRQAQENGAGIIDWYDASIGHDACKSRSVRWVEPIIPANPAAPLHPNFGGMVGASQVVVGAIGP